MDCIILVYSDWYFQPAKDRKRPNSIEMKINVPAHSKVVLTMDFDKAFLKYTEYPPDASRGFDIG